MTDSKKIKGSITALITPFAKNGSVDEAALASFIDWQIEQGSHGLVPCGTTGESPTLTHTEHCQVVAFCVKQASGRVPVIAGTGSNATHEAIDFTQHAESVGADAALVVSPYYNKPSQEGLFQHFAAIAEQTSLPIIIYNIPGRSIVDISNETMARLAEIENIIGVKDATSDLSRLPAYDKQCGKDFVQLSGEDATTLDYMKAGGIGAISVSANVAPRLCADFQEACLSQNWAEAERLDKVLQPLHQGLFSAPSPSPSKYVASRLGLCESSVRLPMIELDKNEKALLDDIIKELGLER
jgi:4-hydroxy-tetrahydrodipicolinate synthase